MHYRVPHLALLSRRPRRRLLLVFALLAVSGCGPAAYRWDATTRDPATDKVYTVQRGDTLYSIAWRYGLDYRELATRNGIGNGFTIYPGQELALTGTARAAPPADASAQRTHVVPTRRSAEPAHPMPRGAWLWPASGPLVAKFGSREATGKGISIGGSVGDDITASADGKVVYAGSGLIGYGKIIILKHSEEYLSAYGHNDTIYVREGEQVKQGDRIASMGRGPGNKPMLHFEIRVNGDAVDPLGYLPSR